METSLFKTIQFQESYFRLNCIFKKVMSYTYNTLIMKAQVNNNF